MTKSKIILLIFIIAIVGAFILSWLIIKRPQRLEIKEVITGDQWTPSVWRAEGEAYIKNGTLITCVKHTSDLGLYGNANFQQGNTPHGFWDNPATLKKEATIYRDQTKETLILYFIAKRTSPITWLVQNENRFCNIGVTLFGDVGLEYENPDTTQPRALIIDFYFSMHPKEIDEAHWLGSDVERDYHSGFKVGRMEEINRDYEFVVRIDGMIRVALRRWHLEKFTIKCIQAWIEVKNAKSSVEISKVTLGLGSVPTLNSTSIIQTRTARQSGRFEQPCVRRC